MILLKLVLIMDNKENQEMNVHMHKIIKSGEKKMDLSAFYLEPEDDTGNHEYKYRLTGLTKEDLEGKTTQLNFRLEEGSGEAIYQIGVTDDGCPLGITNEQIEETLENIRYMAEQVDATVQTINTSESPISLRNENYRNMYARCYNVQSSSLTEDDLTAKRFTSELLIRRNRRDNNYVGLRIAIAGNVDSGKTSLIGVLSQGVLDDGKGGARQHVFNFKHEVVTGRTTSVAQEIIGFDASGNIVNEKLRKIKAPTWPEIVAASSKICTFYDMAGHEKYFNTTIRGISGIYPDYCFIMIGANMGVQPMTREHMIICLMNKIPMIIVFTKIDMCPEHILKKNIKDVTTLLSSSGVYKTPFMIKEKQDVINYCHNISSGAIVPIFTVSNVTGANLDLLKTMLNCLPTRLHYHEQLKKPAHFTIQETFQVGGIGTVVSGFLMTGVVSVKNTLWLGPDSNGDFSKVVVKSIHDKRTDVSNAFAGQNVCFALRGATRSQTRKGMVLIDGNEDKPKGFSEFIAEIEIFGKHSTSMRRGYQPVIHIANIKQSAEMVEITDIVRGVQSLKDKKDDVNKILTSHDDNGNPIIRAGDKARVRFRFCFTPVYFEQGAKILFREGKTRGAGIVDNIISLEDTKAYLINQSKHTPVLQESKDENPIQKEVLSGLPAKVPLVKSTGLGYRAKRKAIAKTRALPKLAGQLPKK